jgi:predicted aspartyl protease
MQISGKWFLGRDGIRRPVIEGNARSVSGRWEPVPFLVDTGADQTAFSADIVRLLGLPTTTTPYRLEGLGGRIRLEEVGTTIDLFQERGEPVSFRGRYAAVSQPEALEMSVLGRDILDLFAVIVDRPGDVVCLVGQRHRYQIVVD